MHRANLFIGAPLLWLGAALLVALGTGVIVGGATPQTTDAQQTNSARLELAEIRNSGVSGTADLREVEGGVEVTMNVQGLPEAGVEHLNHFHGGGTCSDVENGENVPVTIPLTTIVAEEDGTGSATTTLDNVTMDQLFDNSQQRIILVHDEAYEEGEAIPPVIACADVNTPRAVQPTMKENTQPLPSSGGTPATSLLLPAAALLTGLGVAGYALLRRR